MRSKSVPVNLLIRKIHTALGDGGEEGSTEDVEEKIDDEDDGSITPKSNTFVPVEDDVHSSPPRESLPSPRIIRDDSVLIRESVSRCNSQDSAESHPRNFPVILPGESEKMLAERALLLPGTPLGSALNPVGMALSSSIPANLLPSQSAAMAAYLNAAAAAAAVQSHGLMITSPLSRSFTGASVSPLINSSSSPSGLMLPETNDLSPDSECILDYSKKSKESAVEGSSENVRKTNDSTTGENVGVPLDLSVNTRKRSFDEPIQQSSHRKPKMEYRPSLPAWPPGIGAQHLPYFAAAVAAAGLSPKSTPTDTWNGKSKQSIVAPSDASKALEKMSELSKIGGEDLLRTMTTALPSNSTSNRHSAWQSHWLNKGAEQAKDVLKCVWCKQSFPSLAALTTHMKEAKHCGVSVPVSPIQSNNLPTQQMSSPSASITSNSSTNSNKPSQSDLNMLIKETMPLPRKLVRGQDVWLGKGAEQTRQILKCMWCGQSFRSLAEMTSHMQQTQHYTNIISQEQIISWRSSDDAKSGGSGVSSSGQTSTGGTSSHVSAVLTCKVCDQAFSSLKELSNHMVKNSHYKEHIMRSITESGGRRRQTREKRKKSLPVRKLLELERAQNDFKNGESLVDKLRDSTGTGRITCEKCNNKIETTMFVDHIRQCVGGISSNQRNLLKSTLLPSNVILPPESPDRNTTKTPSDKSPSPTHLRSSSISDFSNKESNGSNETNVGSSPSVLNAIEKLIEKSFDSRGKQNPGFPGHGHPQTSVGSSILKRLGIDESVDYTKPLVDTQTMNLLRSYHQQSNRRERSCSESSSISERGHSHIDSLTPDKRIDSICLPSSSSNRTTPETKREKSPFIDKQGCAREGDLGTDIVVKKEPEDSGGVDTTKMQYSKDFVKIKEERDDSVEEEKADNHTSEDCKKEDNEKQSETDNAVEPSSPCLNSAPSPGSTDHSGSPQSQSSVVSEKKNEGGSLGALSSMFDNLSGTNSSNEPSKSSGNKKGSSHPLAALQKLCDKTDTNTNRAQSATFTSASVPSTIPTSVNTTPGAILAFSWACNDAVVTPDSIMKCAFCDTPFISKGAYRHHLSKMHFVKDGVIPDPVTIKSTTSVSTANNSSVGISLNGTAGMLPSGSSSGTTPKSPTSGAGFDESPHSKFLKYTELAKQLSSKYV
ncbi:hypothetical protein ABEB36_008515 [Hypothenemus hampei]|uniref:C2H2-type domain-containing protein n=1 Tax=Hypothenemus hampei TaxID=57062 RepID=A0ABD1EQ17_HYPHA